MPNNFRFWQPSLHPSPLQGQYGQAWGAAFGAVKDALVDRLKQSVKTKFPLVCPPDALQLLGLERGIIRGVSETTAAYAGRVQRAWDSWQWAGSAFGLLSQLFAIGYTSTVIISRGITYQLNAAGQLVIVATQPKMVHPYWNTFSVIVPHPYPPAWVGLFNWNSGIHVGTGLGGFTISGWAGTAIVSGNIFTNTGTECQVTIKIILGGSPGTATYQYSLDGGFTYSSTLTTANSGFLNSLDPNTGNIGYTASGTFVAGDRYYFSQIPPADGGPDSNVFRSVISQWKPANAQCLSINILQTGWLYGYPAQNWGASHLPWGGCSITSWAPPTN